jgi:processive 1,2-diacylglycerol beta-glucosyltransferase
LAVIVHVFMLDLLILTAGYGEGHNAAARGLLAASEQLGIRAEIADCFTALGERYDQSRRQYLEVINRAPGLWAFVYGWVDRVPLVEFQLPLLAAVGSELNRIISEKKPRVVVSVYPVYAYFIERLFSMSRPFSYHTVITDSITINRVWHRAPSDCYWVPNEESAAVLRGQGLDSRRIHTLGFPVNPRFAADRPWRPDPSEGARVLFMINAGKDVAPSIVSRLLDIPNLHLTVTVGRDEELRSRIEAVAAGRPLEIVGWTSEMPKLLMTHHVLIGKAGGATVQEAIAARTPMIITQVVPGQEEGNAQLLFDNRCAELCPTPVAIAQKMEQLFADDARLWREWYANISRLSRPDAAFRLIERFMKIAPSAK